jgi:hypothetical protein
MSTPGLGRIEDPDERDQNYPVRRLFSAEPAPQYRYYWDNGAWLDQGSTGTCVGHAWSHWVEDSPIRPAGTIDPYAVYREATHLDPWLDNDDDLNAGTSVRAGVDALRARGHVTNYYWAFTIDEMVRALLEVGPLVVGTNWYESMYEPANGGKLLVIDDSSFVVGGHAYVLNGVSTTKQRFRVKNSWGRAWGRYGRAAVSFDTMERLLSEGGEACIGVQQRVWGT